MSMLRTLDRRGTMPDVVVHYSSTTAERMIFRDEIRDLADRHEGLTLHQLHTDHDGMLDLADLDTISPTGASARPGPAGRRRCSTPSRGTGSTPGWRSRCTSSASPSSSTGTAARAARCTFQNSGKEIEVDGATTVLEAGEQAGVGMPYGCRMGICHTCTLTLVSGTVRDLRTGDEHDDTNDRVQTCVTVPVGDCTLDI